MVTFNKIDVFVSDQDRRAPNISAETLGIMRGWSTLSVKLLFEMFNPANGYDYTTRKTNPKVDEWPLIELANGPDVVEAKHHPLMAKMVKASWKVAEPETGAQRGSAWPQQRRDKALTIGTGGKRGERAPQGGGEGYRPQVRPTASNLGVKQGSDTAIASDWWYTNFLQRTNAVTFRGDKRDPSTLFEAAGFKPPNTRTDAAYQDNQIANAFAWYMQKRYGRQLSPEQIARFGAVLRGENVTDEERELLYCYAVWKRLLDRESGHLGRMVDNEFMKGFISTSRSLDTAAKFATSGSTIGWVYVTVVHAGYVVPSAGPDLPDGLESPDTWVTQESEIAQFGPIAWPQIVGFRRFKRANVPSGPIFLRRSFLQQEPQACGDIYEMLSGKTPAHFKQRVAQ